MWLWCGGERGLHQECLVRAGCHECMEVTEEGGGRSSGSLDRWGTRPPSHTAGGRSGPSVGRRSELGATEVAPAPGCGISRDSATAGRRRCPTGVCP